MLKKVLTVSLGVVLVIFGLVASAVMLPVDYAGWNPLTTLGNALRTTGGSRQPASAKPEASGEPLQAAATADLVAEKIDFLLTGPAGNPDWWGQAAQQGLTAGELQKVLLAWNSSADSKSTGLQGGGGFTASSGSAPASLASAAGYSSLSGADDEGAAPLLGAQDPLNNAVPFPAEPTVNNPTPPNAAVPESSTLSLMLLGIALVAFSRWKKAVNF